MNDEVTRARIGRIVVRLLILAAASLLLASGSAAAQEDSDGDPTPLEQENAAFALAPGARDGKLDRGQITLEVFPGQIVEDTISIFNFSEGPITFVVWAGDAYNTSDGAYAIFGDEVTPTDVGSWVELPTANVTVGPNSAADVPFLIRVPQDAEPGDHAGGVAVLNTTPVESIDEESAEIDILRAVGTRIFIRVAGPLNPDLDVRNVKVSSSQPRLPYISGTGEATVEYEIVNTGNLRLAPTTSVEVSGPFGIARSTSEELEARDILPGSSIQVRQTVDDVAPLGRMTAEIKLSAGETEVTRTTSFWAIPWLYLLLIAVIVGGVWWYRRLRQNDSSNGDEDDEFGESTDDAGRVRI